MSNRIVVLIFICLVLFFPIKIEARRGGCSHHGGVSGCNSSGRQVCRDGTLSPTCTCTPGVNDVYGCTDKNAINYNSNANRNDGSCIYYVSGCTDKTAINYNSNANRDDGSCTYSYDKDAYKESSENSENNTLLEIIGGLATIFGISWLSKKIK